MNVEHVDVGIRFNVGESGSTILSLGGPGRFLNTALAEWCAIDEIACPSVDLPFGVVGSGEIADRSLKKRD